MNKTLYIRASRASTWRLAERYARSQGIGIGEFIMRLFEKNLPTENSISAVERAISEARHQVDSPSRKTL